ncbi:hypothetical protein HDU85_003481 [Gaertneriomyces sp. JEL0708]|nr:hypothetical protein HDU85_003481 [Gaertneriomyces sp. JEL0708]
MMAGAGTSGPLEGDAGHDLAIPSGVQTDHALKRPLTDDDATPPRKKQARVLVPETPPENLATGRPFLLPNAPNAAPASLGRQLVTVAKPRYGAPKLAVNIGSPNTDLKVSQPDFSSYRYQPGTTTFPNSGALNPLRRLTPVIAAGNMASGRTTPTHASYGGYSGRVGSLPTKPAYTVQNDLLMMAYNLQKSFPESSLSDLVNILKAADGDTSVALLMCREQYSAKAKSFTGSTATVNDEFPKKRRLIRKGDTDAPSLSRATGATMIASSNAASSKQRRRTKLYPSDNELEETDESDDEGGASYRLISNLDEKTVEFFNAATPQQLIEATLCSAEQADYVISLRPYSDISHLRASLGANRKQKALSNLPDKYQDVMEGYGQVDELIERCEKFGDEVMTVLKGWTKASTKQADDISGVDGVGENIADDGDAPEVCLTQVDDSAQGSDEDVSDSGDVEGLASKSFKCLRRQPSSVNPSLTLKGYQLIGISWLYMLQRKGLGGILADEMGLGKTAQVITFIAHLKAHHPSSGPHLVVVPASTLTNWMREFQHWCPSLRVRSYYGTQRDRFEQQAELVEENLNRQVDVFVTTYNLATGGKDDRSFLRKLRCKSLILDEGHMVKNMESMRLLLTGTPLQNNLMELLALLTFIMPTLFNDISGFTKIFNVKTSSTEGESGFLSRQRIQRAKKIMAPFVLRRKKIMVLRDLPQKVVRVEKCKLTQSQEVLYQSILAESRKALVDLPPESTEDDISPQGKKGKKAAKPKKKADNDKAGAKQLQNYLMQLRKAANHPLLFRTTYTDKQLWDMSKNIMKEVEYMDANRQYIFEDMQVMSDFELHKLCVKFPQTLQKHQLSSQHWMDAGKIQHLAKLLPARVSQGDRLLIFSQFISMLDILESVLGTLDIQFKRMDGQTPTAARQDILDEFTTSADIPVLLLSTKAGGFGINLTAANVVILYDIDFNPHNDKQAEDRAHRVGQTKDVTVIKMVCGGTVEERIMKLADQKLTLDQKVQAEGEVEADDEKPKGGRKKKTENTAEDDESTPIDSNVLELLKEELIAPDVAS